MIVRQSLVSWLWKIPVCTAALVAGQMAGVALVAALGMELPPPPAPVDPAVQMWLMLAAGAAIALALAVLAAGLAGRWWERWAALWALLYGVYAVGNAIEASIFTTLGGELAGALMHLPATLLSALAVALLFPGPAGESLGERLAAFFRGWPAARLAGRLVLAWLAFPVCYLLFGMIIAPIVTPYYARMDFLVIPPMPTIFTVLFGRSALFLLVSLPLVAGWRGTRPGLVAALGLAHFVAVGFAGLVQTTFFPAILRWTHGVEILADSVCYAWALVWLLLPRRRPAGEESEALRERLA